MWFENMRRELGWEREMDSEEWVGRYKNISKGVIELNGKDLTISKYLIRKTIRYRKKMKCVTQNKKKTLLNRICFFINYYIIMSTKVSTHYFMQK